MANIVEWGRRLLGKMLPKKGAIDGALGLKSAQSQPMIEAVNSWKAAYSNNGRWLFDKKTGIRKLRSANMAASIASVVADLVALEADITIAEDVNLNLVWQRDVMTHFRTNVEIGVALGGLFYKPFVDGNGNMHIDNVQAGESLIVKVSANNEVHGVVFFDKFVEGDNVYTRTEHHDFDPDFMTHTIVNRAFMSTKDGQTDGVLGDEIPLSRVAKWSRMLPSLVINNVMQPLFGHFTPAVANNIDAKSAHGMSIFSRVMDIIPLIDIQITAMEREFRVKEAKQYVDVTAIPAVGEPLPYNDDDYYVRLNMDGKVNFFESYNPTIQETSFINALNAYLRRVEDGVGFARGTYSEVEVSAKTAAEVMAGKQRTYTLVISNQRALKRALDQTIYALSVWAQIDQVNRKTYVLEYMWGDSAANDPDKELQRLVLLHTEDIISRVEFRERWFGETEEEALKQLARVDEEKKAAAQSMVGVMGGGEEDNAFTGGNNGLRGSDPRKDRVAGKMDDSDTGK